MSAVNRTRCSKVAAATAALNDNNDAAMYNTIIANHVPAEYQEYLTTAIRCEDYKLFSSILCELIESGQVPNRPELRALLPDDGAQQTAAVAATTTTGGLTGASSSSASFAVMSPDGAYESIATKYVPEECQEYLATAVRCGEYKLAASIMEDLITDGSMPDRAETRMVLENFQSHIVVPKRRRGRGSS